MLSGQNGNQSVTSSKRERDLVGKRKWGRFAYDERYITTGVEEAIKTLTPLGGNPLSRNTSSNTITQVQVCSSPQSSRSLVEAPSPSEQRGQSRESTERPWENSRIQCPPPLEQAPGLAGHSSDVRGSSSSSDSGGHHPMPRSRALTHRPRYSAKNAPRKPLSDADEDEDSPPFLPFSHGPPPTPPAQQGPAATVRISLGKPGSHEASPSSAKNSVLAAASQSHANRSSSSSDHSQPQTHNCPQLPLSALSPRQRRMAKEGSEGTHSMGSSFSDLDDASITQSALEEALANEMTQGGGASRMSTISQALKSRYL